MNIHTADIAPVSVCYWRCFSCANQALQSSFITDTVIIRSVLNTGLGIKKEHNEVLLPPEIKKVK